MFRKVLKSSFVVLLALALTITAAFSLGALVDANEAGGRLRHRIVGGQRS